MFCAEITVPIYSKSLLISTWYWPPNSSLSLFDDSDLFFQKCESENKELIVIGDINCAVLKASPDSPTQQFNFCVIFINLLDQIINLQGGPTPRRA